MKSQQPEIRPRAGQTPGVLLRGGREEHAAAQTSVEGTATAKSRLREVVSVEGGGV